jgi:hypothetical protein
VVAAACILAASLCVAMALLAVPVEAVFALEREESTRGVVTFRWLFGLVRVRVEVPRAGSRAPAGAGRGEGGRRRSRGGGRALAMLRQGAFRRRAGQSLRDLLRVLRPRDLRLRVRLGLDDPADTGRLWGLLWPVVALAQALGGAEVRLEPEFLEEAVQFQAQGRVAASPLRLLAIAGGLALSPATVGAWWASRGRGA